MILLGISGVKTGFYRDYGYLVVLHRRNDDASDNLSLLQIFRQVHQASHQLTLDQIDISKIF